MILSLALLLQRSFILLIQIIKVVQHLISYSRTLLIVDCSWKRCNVRESGYVILLDSHDTVFASRLQVLGLIALPLPLNLWRDTPVFGFRTSCMLAIGRFLPRESSGNRCSCCTTCPPQAGTGHRGTSADCHISCSWNKFFRSALELERSAWLTRHSSDLYLGQLKVSHQDGTVVLSQSCTLVQMNVEQPPYTGMYDSISSSLFPGRQRIPLVHHLWT